MLEAFGGFSNFFSGKVLLYVYLMVDFDFFRQECPSISFFFARLGVFLEYPSSRNPQVGLFVSHFTPLKPILLCLYSLIRHSLIEHHLGMAIVECREDDVRSSKLETGLSSNAESLSKVVDIVASKLPSSSSSPSLHALFETCSLKESHLTGFRKRFQFPKDKCIHLPRSSEKAYNFAHGEVCFYEANFLCGLRFLVHPFIMQLLHNFQIASRPRLMLIFVLMKNLLCLLLCLTMSIL